MSEISKQALKVDNSTSFPNNTTGYISPTILRAFNVNVIDSTVNQVEYTANSGSWNLSIGQLNAFTASQQPSFTALNSFTASQLTINTGVNLFTQSAGSSITQLNQATASLQNFTSSINQIIVNGASIGTSTRLFFNGYVSASIVPNVDGPIASITILADQTFTPSASFNAYTASTNAFTASTNISISNLNTTTASLNTSVSNLNTFSASTINSINDLNSFSSSLNTTFATDAELTATASALQANINAISSSYATTGSNVFTGDQTLIDAAGNRITLADVSGSLMLVGSPYTSSSLHISASNSGSGNIIFKFNDITSDTIISGSGNIFSNQIANTAGFKRYIGGNNNIFSGVASVPQISGSMAISPTIATNYLAGNMIMRGPVSSSAWSITQNNILGTLNIGSSAANNAEKLTSGLSLAGNYVAGTLSLIANNTALTSSTTTLQSNNINGTVTLNLNTSAATFSGNSINDGGFVLNNTYFSSSAGLGAVTIQRNTIAGNTNTFTITGSVQATATAQPQFNDNLVGGANNTIFSDYGNSRTSGIQTYGNFHRSIVYGNTLIVTASMSAGEANTQGSAFFGRYNVNDGIRNKADYTVFSVGTGNSTTRKTGFLIDSGSNIYVEGSLNVSASLSLTGSAYGNVFSASIVSSTASIDLNVANFFRLSLPNGVITNINVLNPKPGTTAIIEITNTGIPSASFSNNVKQQQFNSYLPSSGSGTTDLLSVISLTTSSVYVANSLNFV